MSYRKRRSSAAAAVAAMASLWCLSGFAQAADSPAIWRPPARASFQWQLTGKVKRAVKADIYDIDLFDNDAQVVDLLHKRGPRVICYISVGSWEDWRPDAAQFPPEVIGNDYADWPGEKWLDIRRIDLLAPIMRARLDACRAKGFDGVEPDNIDGFTNDTGFPLTYGDQLDYNLWLALEAHARGLSIGLKNDGEQVGDLLPHFDWALTEDCLADGWCDRMQPFAAAGKPVFMVEYTDRKITRKQLCKAASARGFNGILKRRSLGAWRKRCP